MTMNIRMPDFVPNTDRAEVRDVMRRTTFLDIETSLIRMYGFRLGMQRPNIESLVDKDQTKLLTAAWGSWWDLYNDGADAVRSVGNHHRKGAFKKDPLDDTYVLRCLWKVLDESDIIVAHNASFDAGWIEGRFMELGWRKPSKYYVYCTFRSLTGMNMTSKKLDYMAQKLAGTKKVKHEGLPLWIGCAEGCVESFEKMEDYNIGDIHDTLYKVFMRTALYANRNKCIDLAGEGLFCSVTGNPLVKTDELYRNRKTGLYYYVYENEEYGFKYRDRYNTRSKKANMGLVTPMISNVLTYSQR